MTGLDEQKAERERQRLLRETERARCAVCGERVQLEDRCNDGLYLHRHCASHTSQQTNLGKAK